MPTSPLDRNKSFDANGLVLDDGAYLSSSTTVPTHTADDGDWYFRKVNPPELYCRESGAWVLKRFFNGGGGSEDIIFTFTGQDKPYLWTTLAAYDFMAEFEFPGTDRLGTIGSISAVIGSDKSDGEAVFKIFDRTNALEISEFTVTSLDRVIVDVGTLSNLPTGVSIFEIHAKRIDVSVQAQISSLRLKF